MDNTQKLKFFAFGATIIVLSFIIYQTPALAVEIELPPVPENLVPIEVAEEAEPLEPEEPPGEPDVSEPVGPDDLEGGPAPEEPENSDVESEPPLKEPIGPGLETIPLEPAVDVEPEPGIDPAIIYEELYQIRRNSDILIFFVIPVSCAFYVIIKFCVWFYNTFLESVL